jgi:site-specific DNA-methyltransferase (adenine-specific)
VTRSVRNQILVGDVRERLSDLPDHCVDCVITSPPYFQLRNYGVSDQIGLEGTVTEWVDELRLALDGLVRVLRPTGSLWLNLGDTYSRHSKFGASAKSLLLAPERLLLALSDDGWIVRNKVIWAKTNPMPHGVGDRMSNSYDVVYFLTRSPSYFFDLDAIRLPHHSTPASRRGSAYPPERAAAPHWHQHGGGNRGLVAQRERGVVGHELGKNPGDVWSLPAANFSGAHFATFPPNLVERPLLATCPELICDTCGEPFRRLARVRREQTGRTRRPRREQRVLRYSHTYRAIRERGPLLPGCKCGTSVSPGIVLDPFFGAGTVAVVAEKHGRDWIGIEINPRYARIAEERLANEREGRRADGPAVDGTDIVLSAAQPSTSRKETSHDQGSRGV